MSERNTFRLAPSRDGIQLANALRIWSQGEEFYVASRHNVNIGKISFHRNGNWQHRLGNGVHRLAQPLQLSGGWLHALEIVHLIGEGVLLPLNQRESAVTLIETPPMHKFLLNIIYSKSVQATNLRLPVEMYGGAVLKNMRLRSGKTLIVIGRIMPFTPEDQMAITDMREKVRVNFDKLPTANDVYIEALHHHYHYVTGNVIHIHPLGQDSFGVTEPCKVDS